MVVMDREGNVMANFTPVSAAIGEFHFIFSAMLLFRVG
jgi:hypothetical protein